MTRSLGASGTLLVVVLLGLAATLPVAEAAHKPHYKAGVDVLAPGEWEAHIVWLRDPHFNYAGSVSWDFRLEGEGSVDVLFLDWENFRAFRDGRAFTPLVDPLREAVAGAQGKTGLTGDLPYFLVFENPGPAEVRAVWEIYADIDWRRWQGQDPGPVLETEPMAASPMLERNESWEMTFDEPGYYFYFCLPHLDMTAFVEVVPAESPDGVVEVEIRHHGFHPEVLLLPAGTPVRWTNHDAVEHSVVIGLLPEDLLEPTAAFPLFVWWLPVLLLPAAAAVVWILLRRRRG